jgi:hypothetical protein
MMPSVAPQSLQMACTCVHDQTLLWCKQQSVCSQKRSCLSALANDFAAFIAGNSRPVRSGSFDFA